MAQLGSEKNPIRFNVKDKRKIRSAYMRNEDKKKYDDNYDRIFRNPSNPVNHRKET
tara:strand:+ start:532 stop:699 length:168 start_codon:yes stop_codon:yes gene_type:complete